MSALVTRRTDVHQLPGRAAQAQDGGHRPRSNEAGEHSAHLVAERKHRTRDGQLQQRLKYCNQVEPHLGEKGIERPKHHFEQRSGRGEARNQPDIEASRRPELEELHDGVGKKIQGNQHEEQKEHPDKNGVAQEPPSRTDTGRLAHLGKELQERRSDPDPRILDNCRGQPEQHVVDAGEEPESSPDEDCKSDLQYAKQRRQKRVP